MNNSGLEDYQFGEGAFYSKIEFVLRDAIGRNWQVGTLQYDSNMPYRLGATYINEDNEKVHPIMLHRAILVFCFRILIEHHAENLQGASIQVIMNISETDTLGRRFLFEVKESDFRIKSDLRNEKIGFKIREHTMLKVPYLLIVGDKEVESNTVTVRTREGLDLGSMSIENFIEILKQNISERS